MCGIVGHIGEGLDDAGFTDLVSDLFHRGPDAQGIVKPGEGKVRLGHTRLAIIDLDTRSSQPISSTCNRYTLVFNGEIYNHQSLNLKLQNLGYVFRTESDTEVLMYWLVEYGADGINELDGMFSFCFHDSLTNSLLLARDHIGEKPLYYSTAQNNFAFCSELSPLTRLQWVDTRLNREALKNYLFFLYTPPPHTLFFGIKELEPGHYLDVDLDNYRVTKTCFFSLVDSLHKQPVANSARGDAAIFSREFEKAVSSRLIADVPVGMYLSSGLDSNAIVAQARATHKTDFGTFTISYATSKEADEYDESVDAKKCAEHYGLPNNSIDFELDGNLLASLEKTVDMFGQPFGNSTVIPAEQLSYAVSKTHKVCLVGDGGDEMLAGYQRYRALRMHRAVQYLPSILLRCLLKAVKALPEKGAMSTKVRRARQFLEGCTLPLSEAYLKWIGYQSFTSINKALSSTGTTPFYDSLKETFTLFENDPIRAGAIVDLLSFVPFNLLQAADRTGMANSLEIRSPFVAKEFVLAMLAMDSKNKLSMRYNKPLLVEALRGMLPEFILNKPKKVFNPPLRALISENTTMLRGYLCSEQDSMILQVLTPAFVQGQLDVFEQGKQDNSPYLWGLATLECWLRRNYSGSIQTV